MIFTDCSASDSDLGSSEDDNVLTEDEEDDSDISYDDELGFDDGGDDDVEVVNISQEGDSFEDVEDIAGKWRRGRISTSTSGEWSRLYSGLQKWHRELSDERTQCVGPLTKPYRR
jgi:hypothetical protein